MIDAVPRLLAGHTPAPSLLHGDLWSGNAGFLADGTPVVFDPAVYYGDAEADLAMTELFGGLPRELLRGLPGGAADRRGGLSARRVLYNLYHVLNHLNLFGGGYRPQAEADDGAAARRVGISQSTGCVEFSVPAVPTQATAGRLS